MDNCSLCNLQAACETPTQQEDRWLEEAVTADAFDFHFQPIVNVSAESIHAHEALVRLPGRNGGEIISEALRRGRVHVFDSYCRQKAIRVAAARGSSDLRVFVNFMPSSIYDPYHCLRSTMAAMNESGLTPAQVTFEVVESEQISNLSHLLRIRDFYRKHGFGFALDDCGTGSNSREMVEAFQPEYLKVDKSLTRPDAIAGCRGELDELLSVGHKLNCRVIAEGIETPDQLEILQSAGVSLMQGWLFGKPQPAMMSSFPAVAACGTV